MAKLTANVQKYLKGAWFYQNKANLLDEKIRVLQSKAMKVTTTYSDVPTFAGFTDHRQDVMDEIVDLQREYKKKMQQCRNKLKEIEFVINMLDDFQERMVLQLRYLYFENWQDIALRLNYEERQVYRIHGRALMNLLEVDKKVFESSGRRLFNGKENTKVHTV